MPNERFRPAPEPDGSRASVRGIVSPAAWDDLGEVAAVCIATDQDIAYFVLPGGAAEIARSCLKRNVVATGRLFTRGGRRYLKVDTVVPIRHAADVEVDGRPPV